MMFGAIDDKTMLLLSWNTLKETTLSGSTPEHQHVLKLWEMTSTTTTISTATTSTRLTTTAMTTKSDTTAHVVIFLHQNTWLFHSLALKRPVKYNATQYIATFNITTG